MDESFFEKIVGLKFELGFFPDTNEERVQPETLAIDHQYQKALNFLE
jgi:hypothetical protein